eukprot:m.139085 g.139085  ORF g.139085 m.139085 type:complete len:118 (+) comp22750_c0_seq4:212-565(+)
MLRSEQGLDTVTLTHAGSPLPRSCASTGACVCLLPSPHLMSMIPVRLFSGRRSASWSSDSQALLAQPGVLEVFTSIETIKDKQHTHEETTRARDAHGGVCAQEPQVHPSLPTFTVLE